MPPRKAKTQKAAKKTANSKPKTNAKSHQVDVGREDTPSPQQQRGPSPNSEAGDEAAQQLLREASSANNTPTKPSPDRGLTQFLETRSASKDRAGGGKLKRPSDQHRAPATSQNHLRPSTIEHLQKFVSSPVRPRRSDDPYDLIDSPTKKRSPDRPQPAKAKSRTGPVNGKRVAATVEAEDAPQSKRPKVNQSNTVKPQKRTIARSAKSAEETGRQPISLAKPPQLPFLASSPEESLFVNQHDQYSRPSSEAVSESDDLPQRNGHSGDGNADEQINEVPEDGPEASLRQILSSPSNPRSGRAVQQPELSSDAEQEGDSSEVEEVGREESVANSSVSINVPDDSRYTATAEDPIELSESIDDDPEEENYDALPLFGQGPLLGQIFHANKQFRSIKSCRKYYNEQGAPKQKLFPKAHNLYRYAQTLVQHLGQDSRRNEELKDDFIASLDAMLRSTNRLNLDVDEPIELKRVYVQHVHAYVMPSLVDLLQGVVDHVCRVARSMGLQKLEIPDVQAIHDIIQCVASLAKRGNEWKTDLKKTELEEIDSEKKRLMKTQYKGTDYKKKRLKKVELQMAEMKKTELMIANFRTNVVVHLQQVSQAVETELRVLQQNREASIRHATQLQNHERRKIEQRNRAIQRELANKTTARLSQLIRLRQQAERNVPLRMALHCGPLPPPGVIAQATRNIDANGEQFERVGMFGQRRQRDEPYYEMLPGEKEWTDEERLELMEALKEHHGPKLWERTFKYFCRPNDPLRMRTASELLRQARYMRDVFMHNDQKDGEMDVFDEWMTDIPDLDLIPFLS